MTRFFCMFFVCPFGLLQFFSSWCRKILWSRSWFHLCHMSSRKKPSDLHLRPSPGFNQFHCLWTKVKSFVFKHGQLFNKYSTSTANPIWDFFCDMFCDLPNWSPKHARFSHVWTINIHQPEFTRTMAFGSTKSFCRSARRLLKPARTAIPINWTSASLDLVISERKFPKRFFYGKKTSKHVKRVHLQTLFQVVRLIGFDNCLIRRKYDVFVANPRGCEVIIDGEEGMWVLEGDEVVAVNGQNVEGKSLDEAGHWAAELLSLSPLQVGPLVKDSEGPGSRWTVDLKNCTGCITSDLQGGGLLSVFLTVDAHNCGAKSRTLPNWNHQTKLESNSVMTCFLQKNVNRMTWPSDPAQNFRVVGRIWSLGSAKASGPATQHSKLDEFMHASTIWDDNPQHQQREWVIIKRLFSQLSIAWENSSDDHFPEIKRIGIATNKTPIALATDSHAPYPCRGKHCGEARGQGPIDSP